MAKPKIACLEPTWVSDNTINLGKIYLRASEFRNAPEIYQILLGKEKLECYFENPGDNNKTRYYLARNNGDPRFLASDGSVWSVVRDTRDDNVDRIDLMGFYFREQGAPNSAKAPGGFLQCAEYDTNTGYHVPGMPKLRIGVRENAIGEYLIGENKYTYRQHKRASDRGEDDTFDERWNNRWILGTVSFRCLGRFLTQRARPQDAPDKELFAAVFRALQGERLVLVDATADDTIRLSVEGTDRNPFRKMLQAGKAIRDTDPEVRKYKPGLGYVLTNVANRGNSDPPHVALTFHRSGNVLFEDTVSHTQYVFGVDEDAYFGCELKPECGRHNRAVDALLSLAPFEAREHPKRKVSELKRFTVRQGEWFAVFCEGGFNNPVDNPLECIVANSDGLDMPRATVDDSIHTLCPTDFGFDRVVGGASLYNLVWIDRATSDIYAVYADMEHSEGEHEVMSLPPKEYHDVYKTIDPRKRAWKIVRNLAARSFSEAGVD